MEDPMELEGSSDVEDGVEPMEIDTNEIEEKNVIITTVNGILNISQELRHPVVNKGILRTERGIFTNLQKIGQGYNASVYLEKDRGRIFKVGNTRALDVEYIITQDLEKIGFPVIETIRLVQGVLVKPYLDPRYFGDKLIHNLTKDQEKGLERLWKNSIDYTYVTLIPLDLKADNIWWNDVEKEWYLVDTGPKLDEDDFYKFEYTLSLKSGRDFIRKLKGDKIIDSWDIHIIYKESKTGIYVHHPKDRDFEIIRFKTSIQVIDYWTEKENLEILGKEYVTHGAKKFDTERNRAIFYLRFLDIDTEIGDIIRSDIKLSKAACAVLGTCGNKEYLKNTIEGVLKLKKDSKQYWDTLTSKQKDVVRYYTNTGYTEMNDCLRNQRDCNIENVKILDDIILNGPKLSDDIVVYRGIRPDANYTSKEISVALEALQPGDFWEDRGFVSTSSQHPPSTFVGMDCCIFQFFLKTGTPAYYVGKQSQVKEEEEIILLPGTLLRYLGKRTGEDGILYGNKLSDIQRKINVYMFEAIEADKRFAISPRPAILGKGAPIFPFQPQDREIGKKRLSYYHLKNMYNKYIPLKSSDVLRVMTWNVHEWESPGGSDERQDMADSINILIPDILAMQEATGEVKGISCTADMGSHNEKLQNVLVIKKNIEKFLNMNVSLGSERCMVVVGIKLGNIKIIVGNLHLEVKSGEARLENINKAVNALEKLARENKTRNIMIMGDFNSYKRGDIKDPKKFEEFRNLKSGYGEGMNVFESIDFLEGRGYRETFDIKKVLEPANTTIHGGRIDFIFVSSDFSLPLKGAYAYYTDLSDHIAIIADFSLPENVRIENKKENLFEASANGNLERVKYLIENGANINARDKKYGSTPLMFAAQNGRLEVVKYLVQKGAAKNTYAKALFFAADGNRLEVAKYLIQEGADINAKNEKTGYTALIEFSNHENLEAVEYLVSKGANVNMGDNKGKTALIYALNNAIKNGNNKIVKFLLENGADCSTAECKKSLFYYELKMEDMNMLRNFIKNARK